MNEELSPMEKAARAASPTARRLTHTGFPSRIALEEKVVELRNQGLSYAAVSAQCHRSDHSVREISEFYGIKTSRNRTLAGFKTIEERALHIATLHYRDGLTTRQISEKIDHVITPATINLDIHKGGIEYHRINGLPQPGARNRKPNEVTFGKFKTEEELSDAISELLAAEYSEEEIAKKCECRLFEVRRVADEWKAREVKRKAEQNPAKSYASTFIERDVLSDFYDDRKRISGITY